jgi:hypothetical protein
MGKKTKPTAAKVKAAGKPKLAKPRNPHARALKESGLFRPKVVPLETDVYRRKPKHPKEGSPDDEA